VTLTPVALWSARVLLLTAFFVLVLAVCACVQRGLTEEQIDALMVKLGEAEVYCEARCPTGWASVSSSIRDPLAPIGCECRE
jgi:hypothetical protein